MRYLVAIFGMVSSLYLLKYREKVGDLVGEAEWMNKVGGVYNIIIVFAVFLFFWSIAYLTGTQDMFLRPLILLLPGVGGGNAQPGGGPDFYID